MWKILMSLALLYLAYAVDQNYEALEKLRASSEEAQRSAFCIIGPALDELEQEAAKEGVTPHDLLGSALKNEYEALGGN